MPSNPSGKTARKKRLSGALDAIEKLDRNRGLIKDQVFLEGQQSWDAHSNPNWRVTPAPP